MRPGGLQQSINDPRDTHRSVYMPIVRDNLPEALALFDAPDPSLIAADRPTTTVPSQGLFLLNNPFVIRTAEAAAEKLLKATTTDTERIRAAYLDFYGRASLRKGTRIRGEVPEAIRRRPGQGPRGRHSSRAGKLGRVLPGALRQCGVPVSEVNRNYDQTLPVLRPRRRR